MTMVTGVGVAADREVQVVGFARRLVGWLIDGAIVLVLEWLASVVTFVDLVVAWTLLYNVLGMDVDGEGIRAGADNILGFMIPFAYFVGFWALKGRTPGKAVLDMKIVGTDGAALTWQQAITRYIAYFISGVCLGVGFFWVAFDARRQAFHDKIARTVVVPVAEEFAGVPNVAFVPTDPGHSGIVVAFLLVVYLTLPITVQVAIRVLPITIPVAIRVLEILTAMIPRS